MISKTNPILSILLILAMLFSFTAVITPAAPVQAAATGVTIYYPATDNVTYVMPGGNVPIFYNLDGAGGDTNAVQLRITNGTTDIATAGVSQISGDNYTTTLGISSAAAAGAYNVIITDGSGHTATQTSSVYVDSTTPVVSISTPNLCWKTSSNQVINWTATIPGIAGEKFSTVQLLYNGVVIQTYTDHAQIGTSTDPYTYTAPGSTTSGQLSILATSQSGRTATAYFPTSGTIQVLGATSINASAPVLPLATYTGGASTTISFTAVGASSANFSYLLVLNKGDGTSENITPGWYAASTTAPTYNWTVSNTVTSTNCSVSVWTKDCAGNINAGGTSSTFTINSTATTTVTLTAPTSGLAWYTGTSENITWTVSNPLSSATHTCTIYYNLNDNVTESWQLATIIGQGNSGSSYWATWSVPTGVASTKARIKVTAQAPITCPPGTGYSPLFTVYNITVAPTLTIVSPQSSTTMTSGTTQYIQYKVSGTPSTTKMDYKIYLLYNGIVINETYLSGAADGAIANLEDRAQCPSTACSYAWNVPSNLPNATYPGPFTIRIMASYMVGPGPQEQMTVQKDSQSFNIATSTTACPTETDTITLYKGWNLISLPLKPESTDITNVLAGVMADVNSVYYYSGGSSGSWTSFVPGTSSTLTAMVDGKAYWVYMKSTSDTYTLTIAGHKCACGGTTPNSPYSYTTKGWNMIGYKSTLDTYTPTTYFRSSCGSVYALPIYYYDGATQTMKSITACTTTLSSGSGYWLYLNNSLGVISPCD